MIRTYIFRIIHFHSTIHYDEYVPFIWFSVEKASHMMYVNCSFLWLLFNSFHYSKFRDYYHALQLVRTYKIEACCLRMPPSLLQSVVFSQIYSQHRIGNINLLLSLHSEGWEQYFPALFGCDPQRGNTFSVFLHTFTHSINTRKFCFTVTVHIPHL